MFLDSSRWERRFDQIVKIVAWTTLVYGVTVSISDATSGSSEIEAGVLIALAAAGTYVVAITMISPALLLKRRRLIVESGALIGSALTMTAVGLTGGTFSPYMLLSLTPILYGALFGAFRIGLATAAFSASLLLVQSYPLDNTEIVQSMIRWIFLYLLVGLTFSQARRILVEEELRATASVQAFEEAQMRLSRLEHANDLLTRLSALADSRELNPIEVGDAALEGLSRLLPVNAGVTALTSEQGPVIVARRGVDSADDVKNTIPLRVGDREVGLVIVSTDAPLTEEEQQLAEDSLRPVSLAFANVQLLQDIARRAIREERARLARELHDEIGPSLASLGLAVDLAILQNPEEPTMASHLKHLRSSVGGLVEEIRATVADLREEDQTSLTEAIQDTVRQSASEVNVEIKVDERRPPRPSVAADVTAIIVEALRNSIRHSGATTIAVHGTADFDTGEVTVQDDGTGFALDDVPAGHFGLIGMRERASKIGAALNVESDNGGTLITIAWGPK